LEIRCFLCVRVLIMGSINQKKRKKKTTNFRIGSILDST
jgi:hypothetical protein